MLKAWILIMVAGSSSGPVDEINAIMQFDSGAECRSVADEMNKVSMVARYHCASNRVRPIAPPCEI